MTSLPYGEAPITAAQLRESEICGSIGRVPAGNGNCLPGSLKQIPDGTA